LAEVKRIARFVPKRSNSFLTAQSEQDQEELSNVGLLDGKNAIITGSARGIGRATAELFVNEGARVLINDIDGDIAEQAAGEIDGETAVFSGDLTEPGVPDELVKKAVDEFGEVDILINNAGYTWDGVAHKMTDEQFQAMLDIHTVAPFRLARAIAPHWREAAKAEKAEGVERFRKLVNISSISGTMGNAGQVNYSAGKSAIVGMTKTLAKEWGGFKINVNAVAFGFVETRLTQAKEKDETIERGGEKIELGIPEQMRGMAAMIIPLGRPAQPEEAAGPVLFLCSELSNYVHGQTLNVTGGQFGGMFT
jgi:3-oxoacyl-[acyl-carrier protein] reductase